MSIAVHVRTPCRLHFGMFSFGHHDQPQFGGVGAMIEPPGVAVSIEHADQFYVHGTLSDRAARFVELATQSWQLPELPRCSIEVESPTEHTGLGVGTQLGLAVAASLRRFLQLPELPIELLATSVGRGKRSAVGMYGFQQGGLIVDAGQGANAGANRLTDRAAVPSEWRFVLVRPRSMQGLAGEAEVTAFADLPPVPEVVTQQLWGIAKNEMLPAIEGNDCDSFGDAVYRYGRLAGECFAAAQGGPFATPQIEELVNAIRGFGIRGSGQSSWGPTVFAITPNEHAAAELSNWISEQPTGRDCEVAIARPNNTGASFVQVP